MDLELVFENRFGKMEYDRKGQVLHNTYKGLFVEELAKELFETSMPFIDKNPVRGTVHNSIEMRGTFTNLNGWFKEVYYPFLIPRGYCCWSAAVSDVFTKFAANLLIKQITPKEVQAKVFTRLEDSQRYVYEILEKEKVA